MSHAREYLLDSSLDNEGIQLLSKWHRFRQLSKTILNNLNWFITISAFVITVAISTMSSGFLINYINDSLSHNLQYDHHDIRRNILMHSDIADNQFKNTQKNDINSGSNRKSRAELAAEVQNEAQIINALEGDVKGQKGIEQRLLKRIKTLEINHLAILKEQQANETKLIWIGIAMCGVMFIGSGFLFYASRSVKIKQ